MKLTPATLIVLSAIAVIPVAAQAQRIAITVGGANFRPYPMAAPDLVVAGGEAGAGGKVAKELSQILQIDVDLARSLELVPTNTYLAPEKEPPTKPVFPNWTNVGASGLIRGQVTVTGKTAKINLRFFDVVSQREMLSRDYEESPERGSRAIHKFLDEVIESLTGEKGIFSSQLSYVRKTRGGKAVFVADFDGGAERRITAEGILSLLPAWLPGGAGLLYTSYAEGNPDLWRIGLDGQNPKSVSNQRGLNTGAAVSPDGRKIALTLSSNGNTAISLMNADGSNVVTLTPGFGQNVSPTWSPDGSRIAFVSSRSGNPHIFVMNADGSNARRLTFQGNYNQEPDWSPKAGGQIAFTARDERMKYDIFLVDPDTGVITRLTQDEGNNESPTHSPDGHHVAFVSTRAGAGGRRIYVMDVDGNNQRLIARIQGDVETPSWGPRLGY